MLNIGMPLRPLILRPVGEQYIFLLFLFCGDFIATATSTYSTLCVPVVLRNDATVPLFRITLKLTKHQYTLASSNVAHSHTTWVLCSMLYLAPT